MKVQTFDPTTIRQIERDVLEAVQGVAAAYGLKVRLAGGRYDDAEWTQRLKWEPVSDEAARAQWADVAPTAGLPADGFGRALRLGQKTFTVAGVKFGRRGLKVLLTDDKGRQYTTPAATAREALARG